MPSLPNDRLTVLNGDCIEVLAGLPPDSVDVIITDPPYGIDIDGRAWDGLAIQETAARTGKKGLSRNEAFQVWCGLWATECLRVMKPGAHLLAFGSTRTAHRLIVGLEDAGLEMRDTLCWMFGTGVPKSRKYPRGRGTTLKPAYEPIALMRRPLDGTTNETIERHGTGALEVEACRVNGRYPANVLLGHDPKCSSRRCSEGCAVSTLDCEARANSGLNRPSRFFYSAKVSRRERNAGCERLEKGRLNLLPSAGGDRRNESRTSNPHPTVKPLALMRWLVRLACPPDGLVLDPFCGSGSTGAAAALEKRRFVGIEQDPDFAEIAVARIEHWAPDENAQVDHVPLARKK